ncbi:MAG: TMEM165/GDT1 family protein [Clostridiales Family XIII bacterium]|jgi:putative Ca2+/H+ antiporter (TMEM165/GDT1 family)|nr:TMEM165/GDT1 family protein [Clostridiales Family XIII bacterium]
MHAQLSAALVAAVAVVLAEMGDKTQLLAMAFAARYSAAKVMLGVLAATVLNHALAVAVGNLVTRFDSAQAWIQGAASLSFIVFGLWTLRGDKLDGEQNRESKLGAFMTVAIAFFLAEMGDKTQLATIALAAKFPAAPLGVLVGTTTGMLVADGFGIVVGILLRKKIPERAVKFVSAGAFVLFGLAGAYQVARNEVGLPVGPSVAGLAAVAAATALAAWLVIRNANREN